MQHILMDNALTKMHPESQSTMCLDDHLNPSHDRPQLWIVETEMMRIHKHWQGICKLANVQKQF